MNKKKSDKELSEWIKEDIENHEITFCYPYKDQIKTALDDKKFDKENFEDFYSKRREMLIQKLQEYFS
jgi:hypothetical protein